VCVCVCRGGGGSVAGMGKNKNKSGVSGKKGPKNVADKYGKLDKATLALIAKDTAMAKIIMKARSLSLSLSHSH